MVSHHVEGFQDYFLYKEDRYAKTIDTRDESPCTSSAALGSSLSLRSAQANSAAEQRHSDPMLPPVVLLLGATRLLVGFTLTDERGIESFLATT